MLSKQNLMRRGRWSVALGTGPYLSVLLFVLILGVSNLRAQCVAKDADIHLARYREATTFIDISLTKRIDGNDLSTTGGPSQWKLDDLTALVNIPIIAVHPAGQQVDGTFTTVLLNINVPLATDHLYRLTNPLLTFMGCKTDPDESPQALLRIKKNPAGGPVPPATPPPINYYKHVKSKGKSDSDVYVNGTVEGARGGKPTFASDIKLERPFGVNKDHVTDFRLYYHLKASSAKNGNADSMDFGGKFNINFDTADRGPLRYVLWTPTAGFESDRRFRNINVTTSQILTFGIPGNKDTRVRRVRVLPFLGYELGRNLRSPVQLGHNKLISRALVGANLYFSYDRSEDSSFSFEVEYTRRFLMAREVSFTEDNNKKLIPLSVGKGPRDYAKAIAEYDFSKFTGVTLSYEYGKLPPNFELVDHKYSAGFVFKFQYQKKSK